MTTDINPDIEALKARLETYTTLLNDAARALEQAETIICENVEDADLDAGYGALINDIQEALDAPDIKPVISISDSERRILRHMLGMGADVARISRGYRNRYVTPPGSAGFEILEGLKSRGLVEEIPHGTWYCFHATEAGMDALGMSAEEKARAKDE